MKAFSAKTKLLSAAFLLAYISLSSCSKKSSAPSTTGHTMTFTITATVPANGSAGATIAMDGAKAGSGASTLWSVNDATQQNQSELSFTDKDFPAGKTTTIVIKSIVPIYYVAFDIFFGGNCTISYQAVVDGKTVNNDQNVSVTSNNSYAHDYTYGGN